MNRFFSAHRGDYNTATDLGFRLGNGYCWVRITDGDTPEEIQNKLSVFAYRVAALTESFGHPPGILDTAPGDDDVTT